MRCFLVMLLTGLLALPRPGQGQPALPTLTVVWQRYYGKPPQESGGYTLPMPGGGYMLVGQREVPPPTSTPNRRLYFVRTDAQGDTLWTKTYVPTSLSNPQVLGAVVDAAGNLLVTGATSNQKVGFVAKLSPTITPLWEVPIFANDARVYATYGFLPVVTADGNYVVDYCQLGVMPTVPQTFFNNQNLLKLDSSTGNTVWDKAVSPYFAGLGYHPSTYLSSLVSVPGGFLAGVDGAQLQPTLREVKATLLLDASGAVVNFRQRTNTVQEAGATMFSNGQHVFVTRRQSVTKLTFTGDTVWHTVVPPRYANRKWDGVSLTQDSRGNILVMGTSTDNTFQDTEFHLARLSASGQVLKDTLIYRGPSTYGRSLLLTAADEPVIGGYVTDGPYGNGDLFLLKLSPLRVLATTQAAAAGAAAPALRCYPNPSAGGSPVRAELPAGAGAGARLTLHDALGRACAEVLVAAGTREAVVPMAGLPPGLYLLRLRLPNGSQYSTRLLRE